MPSLAVLLRRHKELAQQQVAIETELADIERQIGDAANAPRARKPRSTKAEMLSVIRDCVKLLRDAGEPLPRTEIADRLGISPHAAAYRLKKAMEAKFVEKVSMGRYRCTAVIPLNG